MKSMVRVHREDDRNWIVWNKKTGECADIIKVEDFGHLSSNKSLYRVDFYGVTKQSMISTFQKARSVATKLVK